MTRRRYRVTVVELSPREHMTLAGIDGRRTVAEALDGLPGGPPAHAEVGAWLRDWAVKGLVLV